MIKHIVKRLAALTALALLCGATAGAFNVGGLEYEPYASEGGKCYVTYSFETDYSGAITIPSTVEYGELTYGVAGIGEYAFAGCEGITSVAIPQSVTVIGRNAFQGCTGLTQISFPAGVAEIADQTFYACTALRGIDAPGVTVIGKGAFSGCQSLGSYKFTASLGYIGDSAFRNCTSLSAIELNGAVELGNYVFSGCNGLERVVLPATLQTIPPYTFYGCTSLRSVSGPRAVREIGEYAFYVCSSLKEMALPNTLQKIDRSAFELCSSLQLEEIPGENLEIGPYAFMGCESLESVRLPGVERIEEEAFGKCTFLKRIELGEKTYRLSNRVFADCNMLVGVLCAAKQPPLAASNTFESHTYEKAVLEVRTGLRLLYLQSPPWSRFAVVEESHFVGVDAVETEDEASLAVTAEGETVTVFGPAGRVEVYDLEGHLLQALTKDEHPRAMQLNAPGAYVVTLNGEARKVIIK